SDQDNKLGYVTTASSVPQKVHGLYAGVHRRICPIAAPTEPPELSRVPKKHPARQALHVADV
ncbi:MAG TPA: hypothetical protein DCP66_06230, partial [Collinsella sp.]|nr:hypothetical protein [Collinsella sp.]